MRTELLSTKRVALFLFAHQDDEFGVFQQIVEEVQAGCHVCCAYLTSGSHSVRLTERRNFESLTVLSQLGVSTQDVLFAGEALSIADTTLPEHMELASNWIQNWLSRYSRIQSVYVPAWEGGHHDHDALHAITVLIAKKMDITRLVWQFPLYNGYRCHGQWFRVLLPLQNNGAMQTKQILWKNRVRFLRLCLGYPSQMKTWLGLFPFVLMHYLRRGTQTVQPVCCERIYHRPHSGPLYYERRSFFTWEKMSRCISNQSKNI